MDEYFKPILCYFDIMMFIKISPSPSLPISQQRGARMVSLEQHHRIQRLLFPDSQLCHHKYYCFIKNIHNQKNTQIRQCWSRPHTAVVEVWRNGVLLPRFRHLLARSVDQCSTVRHLSHSVLQAGHFLHKKHILHPQPLVKKDWLSEWVEFNVPINTL